MFRFFTILSLIILTGCNTDFTSDTVKGNWTSVCYYASGNVLTGVNGQYSFSGGVFTANMQDCVDTTEITVSFPYSLGKYVMIGNDFEARELNIHINDNDIIPVLVYVDPDTDDLFWSWGLDNTSIEHSAFGFFMVDDVAVWGGYPLIEQNDQFVPITEGFPELARPTTVSFKHYLEMD